MALLINYVVPAIHVLSCLFLIVVVLLQTGKGADMGAVFGGGSQTLFGSSGAGNFLTKLTTGTAILFMVTSLILTYGSARLPSSRLLEHLPAPVAESPTETVPAPPAEAQVPAAGDQPSAPAPDAPAPTPGEAPADAPAPER
jgi:preprotein translocase subunit SecG